jgi:hypothetical protein
MPSINHEEAILVIRQHLSEELGLTLEDFYDYNFKYDTSLNLIPDLCVIHPKHKKYIVIEVGNTSAEKINQYLQCDKICEIRWYTKKHDNDISLVAKWENGVHVPNDIDKTYVKKIALDKTYEIESNYMEKKLRDMNFLNEAYVLCSGCGCHIKVEHLGVNHGGYGHKYGVCPSCDKEGFFYSNSDYNRAESDLRFTVMQYLVNKRREILST